MLIWGASIDGGRYSAAMDTWMPLSTVGAPSLRGRHTAVWTGTEMLVWGGCCNHSGGDAPHFGDGGKYTPATNSWTPIATAGAPTPT
jgi:hypothetical protein